MNQNISQGIKRARSMKKTNRQAANIVALTATVSLALLLDVTLQSLFTLKLQAPLVVRHEPVAIASEPVINHTIYYKPTKEEVKAEIIRASQVYGVNTDRALFYANCESGYKYDAKNKVSTARGVYQYIIGTWEATESAKQGKERNDYKANIQKAMIDMANGEWHQWTDCTEKWNNRKI